MVAAFHGALGFAKVARQAASCGAAIVFSNGKILTLAAASRIERPLGVDLGHPGCQRPVAGTWGSTDADLAVGVDDHPAPHHAGERRVWGAAAIGAVRP